MPDMTPVGTMFKPPDPNAGLNTYSNILGIQNQQQNLQIQQQQLKQQQIQAQEMQAISDIGKNPPMKDDGKGNQVIDPDAFTQQLLQRAPNFGLPKAGNLLDALQKGLDLKKSYLALDTGLQNEGKQIIGAWSAHPDAPLSDLASQLENWSNERKDHYPGVVDVKNNLLKMLATYPDPQHQKMFGQQVARSALDQGALTGPQGLATPQPAQVDANGQIINGTRAPALAGGGFTQTGEPIKKTTAPWQTPEYAGRVAQASASGTGTASGDIDRKNQISAAVAPSNNAISTIAEMRSLTRQISQGSFSQQILKASQAAGDSSPEITARNLLKKDMANLKTSVGSAATTDAQRSTIDQSFPDLENPDVPTVTRALDRIEGTMRQNLVRSRSAQDYLKKHPDAGGLQQADDRLMSNSDPLVHTYNALPTAPDRAEFLKRHFNTDEERRNFVNSKKAHDHVGGLND